MIPAVEGLLPEPYNGKLVTLLFRLAEWHALAKLRTQTENTLHHLNQSTITIGQELRSFREWSRSFNTVELPCETATRERRRSKKATLQKADSNALPVPSNKPTSSKPERKGSGRPNVKFLNLLIYKLHALGDYVQTIKLFGTTDSYSTQIVSLNFRTLYQISYWPRVNLHIAW
jgi:hypothetical protein